MNSSPLRLAAFLLWALSALQSEPIVAEVGSTPSGFGYFLDGFTVGKSGPNVQVPASIAIIGNTASSQRAEWVAQGHLVGTSMGFDPNTGGSSLPWSQIACQVTGNYPSDGERATAILAAAGGQSDKKIPDAFPDASEKNVLYMQDIESNFGTTYPHLSGTNAGAAAYIALFWAARQTLGKDFMIIPVVSSAILKLTPQEAGIKTLVSQPDGVLAALHLDSFLPADSENTDLLSFLHEAHLIDGFLGEQYDVNNSQAPVGSFSCDTTTIQDTTLPWAVLSDAAPAESQFTGGGPYTSAYWGQMPLQAALYLGSPTSQPPTNPTQWLIPKAAAASWVAGAASYCKNSSNGGVLRSRAKLTVNINGAGSVNSLSGRIQCKDHCTAEYPHNETEILAATPVPGKRFVGWTCTGCQKTNYADRIFRINMRGTRMLTAHFVDAK